MIKNYKVILFTVAFIFVINIIGAQNNRLNNGRALTHNYYTEIAYEDVKGKIIIPVTIENNVYRFLFDTGAPNLISSELKNKLAYNTLSNISVKDANNNRNRMELVKVPLITIGNVSFKNTTSLVHELEDNLMFNCFKIHGIIGSNMLRKSIVKILPKEKLIIITNNRNRIKPNKKYQSKLTLVGDQSSPYISIKMKGVKTAMESVLFDTGMDGLYDMSLKSYSILKSENIFNTRSQGKGTSSISLFGNAKQNNHFRITIPEININGVLLNNLTTETSDDNHSRIGSELLKYGNVTIDFKNKRFYFEPFEDNINLEKKQLGFTPTIIDNKVVVGFVWDESLTNKIKYGDEIMEVNGIDFQKVSACDVLTKKTIFEDSGTLRIVFKNNKGELNTLTLNKYL